MHKIYTKIGEHAFEVTADSANLMNLFTKNFTSLKKVTNEPVDMVVHIHGGYGTPLVTSDFSISEESSKLIFRRDDYLIDIESDYHSANLYVYNGLALKQAFINLYSSFIVFRGWGLLVHGECVVDNGLAHLLCGESVPSASPESDNLGQVLTHDEVALIKISPEDVRVFDSPFHHETASEIRQPSPIGSIHFLQQAFQDKRMKIGRTYSLLRLLDTVFYWPHNTEQTKRVLTLLRQLVHVTPIYANYFQKSDSIRELIS